MKYHASLLITLALSVSLFSGGDVVGAVVVYDALIFPDTNHTVLLTTNDSPGRPHTTEYQFTNSLTCGMQEVDNLVQFNTNTLNDAGLLRFVTGVYTCYTNTKFANAWALRGAGMGKTIIVDATPTNNCSVATLLTAPWQTAFIFFDTNMTYSRLAPVYPLDPILDIHDITFMSATNAPKCFIAGEFDGGEMSGCAFGRPDYRVAGFGKQSFNYIASPLDASNLLIGIFVECDNKLNIHDCAFAGLAQGIWACSQLVQFSEHDNFFVSCNGTSYPPSSFLHFGCGVVVDGGNTPSQLSGVISNSPALIGSRQNSFVTLGSDQFATGGGAPYVINFGGYVKVTAGFWEKVHDLPLVYQSSHPVDFENGVTDVEQITVVNAVTHPVTAVAFGTLTNGSNGILGIDYSGANDNGSYWSKAEMIDDGVFVRQWGINQTPVFGYSRSNGVVTFFATKHLDFWPVAKPFCAAALILGMLVLVIVLRRRRKYHGSVK